MKRDMDLVRLMLIEVEKADSYVDLESLACDEYPLNVIGYHAELLEAHGLVDANVKKAWGGMVVGGSINGLTWDGCDYLDAIRDERVWNKAKKAIRDTIGSTTIDAVKDIAVKVGTNLAIDAIGGLT